MRYQKPFLGGMGKFGICKSRPERHSGHARGFGDLREVESDDKSNRMPSKRELRKENEFLRQQERARQRESWRERVKGRHLETFPEGRPFVAIIDGNNVMGATADSVTKSDLLRRVENFVNMDLHMEQADVILVFDSRGPRSIDRRGRMEILFCGKGTLADDVIVKCVEDELSLGRVLPVVVVTSDLELSVRALKLGSSLMKSDTFYQMITPITPSPPAGPGNILNV